MMRVGSTRAFNQPGSHSVTKHTRLVVMLQPDRPHCFPPTAGFACVFAGGFFFPSPNSQPRGNVISFHPIIIHVHLFVNLCLPLHFELIHEGRPSSMSMCRWALAVYLVCIGRQAWREIATAVTVARRSGEHGQKRSASSRHRICWTRPNPSSVVPPVDGAGD